MDKTVGQDDFDELEVVRAEYKLFDLTVNNISEVKIKKSLQNNCYIGDESGNLYNGFILNKKNDGTQSNCEVNFFASSKNGKFIPRLTFTKNKKNGSVKDAVKPEKVRIAFGSSGEGVNEFWIMVSFLSRFKEIVDVGEFENKYGSIKSDEVIIRLNGLPEDQRLGEVVDYIKKTGLNIGSINEIFSRKNRKDALKQFKDLLDGGESFELYRTKYNLKGLGEEKIWHHFLKTNIWLLGLNLDIRFIQDFTEEVSVGNPNTENEGNPKVDLMGLSDYTTLVELKTSNTSIFTELKAKTARAKTWSFSPEFIDGISQCLSQKFAWDRESSGKDLVKNGVVLDKNQHRTVDPKTIFIIGNKGRELPKMSTDVTILVKKDTFELFRRNSRNIDIITFDELYERADHMVNSRENNEPGTVI